ncbi:MAG: hypothetical protein EOL87_19275 [Spartobacteria bacterium]|nr:hypothetical protein [Spartobacteria bacterium]
MGMVTIEEVRGSRISALKFTGVELESIEEYISRQNGMKYEIRDCYRALYSLGDNTVSIDGNLIRFFDNTRPLLLEFLTATKAELERQLREMPLMVRIRSDEEEGKSDES